MVKPYSQDLRERVMSAVDDGVRAAAPLFRVSISYIDKALIRRRATGERTARRSGGAPKPKLAEHGEALRQRIAEHFGRHLGRVAELVIGRAAGDGERRLPMEHAQSPRLAA